MTASRWPSVEFAIRHLQPAKRFVPKYGDGAADVELGCNLDVLGKSAFDKLLARTRTIAGAKKVIFKVLEDLNCGHGLGESVPFSCDRIAPAPIISSIAGLKAPPSHCSPAAMTSIRFPSRLAASATAAALRRQPQKIIGASSAKWLNHSEREEQLDHPA